MIKTCPQITWSLINSHTVEGSWYDLCLQSVRWMSRHYHRPLSVGPDASLAQWIQHIALDSRWKGRIRKTIQLALAHHRSYAEQAIWQCHMELKLTTCGLTMPTASSSPPLMEKWQWDLCMKVFQSTRALAMHASRDHGYRAFSHPLTHSKLVDSSSILETA